MKKGIILEKHRKYTIVMSRDGSIEKAHPIHHADIGFEVNYEPISQKGFRTFFKGDYLSIRMVALVTVFMLFLFPLYMVFDQDQTYAYVDIDINPSIELAIDKDFEVLEIIPLNDDAIDLIRTIGDLEGKEIKLAIEQIVTTYESNGLDNVNKNVLIGVHVVKGKEKEPLVEQIESHFTEQFLEWKVVTVTIPDEIRKVAEENKQSMNKVLANSLDANRFVSKEENEVLQSFFNPLKASVEIQKNNPGDKDALIVEEKVPDLQAPSTKEMQQETDELLTQETHRETKDRETDAIHPSELKGMNGYINSNKNSNRKHPKKDYEALWDRGRGKHFPHHYRIDGITRDSWKDNRWHEKEVLHLDKDTSEHSRNKNKKLEKEKDHEEGKENEEKKKKIKEKTKDEDRDSKEKWNNKKDWKKQKENNESEWKNNRENKEHKHNRNHNHENRDGDNWKKRDQGKKDNDED